MNRCGIFSFLLAVTMAFAISAPAMAARELIAGPVDARVVEVIDGDTFSAEAHVWPGHVVRVSVRIRGIDAPERRSRCAEEREAAQRARAELEGLVGGRIVTISNIDGDKYFGRVLADVETTQGPAAALMLDAGLVRPYQGGRRAAYCSWK